MEKPYIHLNTLHAEQIFKLLNLTPLPNEGGFYRETYRSKIKTTIRFEGSQQSVTRTLNTQIYYMVTPTSFSALHRLKQDEVYYFFGGEPADVLLITDDGTHQKIRLGTKIQSGEVLQLVVPAGTWQGIKMPAGTDGYSLMGTSVSPGFEFEDFELGDREALSKKWPLLSEIIHAYTR